MVTGRRLSSLTPLKASHSLLRIIDTVLPSLVPIANGTNGTHSNGHSLPLNGVFAPVNTFYLPDSQDLDLETYKTHVQHIALSGVGIVALGSMGEAVHLTHDERNTIVETARAALDASGVTDLPLIVGTGGNSTRETISLTKDAAARGADYAMVITPGYFAGALNREALKAFFVDVAKESPIPIIIYNFPAAAAGIELDSDIITEIALAAPNVCGVKLTCGSVGKLSRLVTARKNFIVLCGFIDILAPSLLVNSKGTISGTANVAPKSCRRLYDLTLSGLSGSPADLAESIKLQSIVSAGDWALAKVGISGTKYALEQTRGYGGVPRRPILPYSGDKEKLMKDIQPLLDYEKSL